ncbi:hypothetical protein TA3x_002868 [Tundrisphaera sp. TA3]|uniref:hypothetical protein n=1 Tax=Tundrisphaera sp. TA3 TaxID=3435775 RepID=UPI003EBD92BF
MDAAVKSGDRALKVRFYVALAVFGLWVAGLASMAVTSGHRPRPASATARPAATP